MSGKVWLLLIGIVVALILLREDKTLAAHDPRLRTGDAGIVMFTAEWCGYCKRQTAQFQSAGVQFDALDIDTDAGGQAFRAVRGRAVPLTIVGQDLIRGYDVDSLRERLAPLGYRL